MTKPIVLVIHGMGSHASNEITNQFTAGINEAAVNFGLTDYLVEEQAELVEFNYSHFFDQLRQRDAAHAQSITAHLQFLQGHGLGENIAAKLSQFFANFDADEMLYTHWLDVIYYGLTFWGEKVRVDLARQLNNIMLKANLENRKVHIVAHSLGTAVLHDTLAKLFRKDADINAEVPTLDVDRFTIDSIWTVANVSRLLNVLNDIADPNHSILHSSANGCCNYLYNVKNEFDPITWPKAYKRNIENGRHLRVKSVRTSNTHDFQEYMAAPPVARMFLFAVFGKMITPTQYTQGVTAHGRSLVNQSYEQLKAAFADIRASTETTDKVKALQVFFTLARDFQAKANTILAR